MHIQDPSQAKELVPHWGYGDRVLPCVNDAGTCEYLDSIYRSHDLSMVYSFMFWAIIAGVLAIWVVIRLLYRYGQGQSQTYTEVEGQRKSSSTTLFSRIFQTVLTFLRRHLYSEFPSSTFSHVSRLQLLVLAILSTYISIFSLVGITYKSWETPHKNNPNIIDTRTGFAGFADRVGVFAFTLTPLTILLSTRENILTLITGISYQHFNFLHRWTGRLIFAQGSMHTFGWMVIKGCLYQPQPSTFKEFITQTYIIWGSTAMCILVFLYVFSIKSVIEWTGYEFFVISHLFAASMFITTCWVHWPQLKCWMIASLVIVLLDFTLRFLYFSLIHFKIIGKQKGFIPIQVNLGFFDDPNGKVVRLDFEHDHRPWKAGQHFMLTFPGISIWQSHPFTILSSPNPHKKTQNHSYIIRCRTGETKKLGELALNTQKTTVLLSGPYGGHASWNQYQNILAISGGTGISFTIPILHEVALSRGTGLFQLVWIIRREQNLNWAGPELEALKAYSNVQIRIFITAGSKELEKRSEDSDSLTRDENTSETLLPLDKRFQILHLNGRPVIEEIIEEYLEKADNNRVLIIGSGPQQLGKDVRRVSTISNNPKEVWRGTMKRDVDFYWDY